MHKTQNEENKNDRVVWMVDTRSHTHSQCVNTWMRQRLLPTQTMSNHMVTEWSAGEIAEVSLNVMTVGGGEVGAQSQHQSQNKHTLKSLLTGSQV